MSEQNQQDFEALSALMDNEADDLELRRLLKSSASQPELLAKWERYHLAQSILHRSAQPVRPELAQRIAAQLATESTPSANQSISTKAPAAKVSGWQQTLGKIAIAASVAVIFVIAMPTEFSPGDAPAVVQQQATPVAVDEVQPTLLAADAAVVELDPVATQFLRDYLEHMRINEEEPAITVHIKDSPLFQLVNQLGTEPQ